MRRIPSARLLDLGLFYAALVWGASFVLLKDLIAELDPMVLTGYRFLLSAAVLLPWALRRPAPGRLLREGMLLGSLLVALYVPQTAGLIYTTASNSGFITGLFVFFVPLFLLLFLGQPPAAGQWVSVAIALAGLWLLTGGVRGFNRGDALTVLAAMTYAGHLLATDRFVRGDADPVLLAFHQFWFCGALSLILAAAAGAPFTVPTARAAAGLAFLVVFANVSAFFVQILAQKHVPALKVSLIFSLEPVFAALFAWTIGGEAFSGRKAAGGALILAAMMLGELSRLAPAGARKKEVLPV